MRRNADGARDFLAPTRVGEEMLTKPLASHGKQSVAGSGGNPGLPVLVNGCAPGIPGLRGILLRPKPTGRGSSCPINARAGQHLPWRPESMARP